MYLVLAAVAIAAVLAILFIRASKRRVISKAFALVNGAKAVAAATLHNDLLSNSPTIDDLRFARTAGDDPKTLARIATASVNFWFGEPPSENFHDLDLRRIQADSMRWLSRSDEVRELVVQAVRMLSTARFAKARSVGTVPHILEVFGAQYPEALFPDDFETLLRRQILKLTADQQADVHRFLGS